LAPGAHLVPEVRSEVPQAPASDEVSEVVRSFRFPSLDNAMAILFVPMERVEFGTLS